MNQKRSLCPVNIIQLVQYVQLSTVCMLIFILSQTQTVAISTCKIKLIHVSALNCLLNRYAFDVFKEYYQQQHSTGPHVPPHVDIDNSEQKQQNSNKTTPSAIIMTKINRHR